MWKPGTVVELFRYPDGFSGCSPDRLGMVATVAHGMPGEQAQIMGCDIIVIPHGEDLAGRGCPTWSYCWRALDANDPSSLTLDEILRAPVAEEVA